MNQASSVVHLDDGGIGQMLDVFDVGDVQIEITSDGRLWVNVDGICRLRISRMKEVAVYTENFKSVISKKFPDNIK